MSKHSPLIKSFEKGEETHSPNKKKSFIQQVNIKKIFFCICIGIFCVFRLNEKKKVPKIRVSFEV